MSTEEPRVSTSHRALRVFLCHSSSDKPAVKELYRRLRADKIDAWLDEEELLAGQDWNLEITKAVRASDVAIVCLSRGSVSKEGYVQKEIKMALDVADEKPEGTIFIIPLKLEECNVPDRLRRWQWVNFFEKGSYGRLVRALQHRAKTLGIMLVRETVSTQSAVQQQDVDDLLNGKWVSDFLKVGLPRIAKKLGARTKKFSIIMVDIDELTIINKHYNRSLGDKVLGTVANIVRLNGSIHSGRCGDDTFYAVLYGFDTGKAMTVAENVRRKIQQHRWSGLAAGLHVTCSLGIAQLHPSEPIEDCVIRAALGMNAAKKAGRNRAEVGPEYLSKDQSRNPRQYFS